MKGEGSRLAFIASVAALFLACKKPPPPAASEDAGIDAGEPIVTPLPVMPEPDAGPRVVSLGEAIGQTSPALVSWGGFYKCGSGKGRLKLTHFESTVTGHMSTGTEEKTYTCKLSGDVCTGTEVDVSQPGKGGKAGAAKSRKLTLRRDSRGTIYYNADGAAATSCTKL